MAFIEGYLLGLLLIVLIGPVLFVLLNITLTQGRRHGIAVALGICMSDLGLVWLLFQGSAQLTILEEIQNLIAIAGGIIVISLGIKYFLFPQAIKTMQSQAPFNLSLLSAFLKGVAVNAINPFVFAVWLGIIGLARQRYHQPVEQITFLMASIAGIITLDLSKVALAHHLNTYLSAHRFIMIQKGSGVVLILFGLRLLWHAY